MFATWGREFKSLLLRHRVSSSSNSSLESAATTAATKIFGSRVKPAVAPRLASGKLKPRDRCDPRRVSGVRLKLVSAPPRAESAIRHEHGSLASPFIGGS
jgi:hypothetical protein